MARLTSPGSRDMMFGLRRRDFIKTSVGGIIAASLPFTAFAKSSQISSIKLSDTMAMISGAGGNVLAAREPEGEGVVMVDGGLAENSHELLKHVHKALGSRDVGVLFNTHWHHEHTGSNLALGKAGAKIIAHENTRLWLTTDITRPWEHVTFEPYPKIAQPNETFYAHGEMPFGDQSIEYGYILQAHTDGDIYVFFPKENVLVTGGVVSGDGWPLVDWWTGGWINGLADGIGQLLQVANKDTRVIPANGPILTRADLEAQHDMYRTISGRLVEMLNKGFGPDEAVAAGPTKEFDAKWGDSKQFVTLAFESLWGHFSPDA